MTINLQMPDITELKPRITVFGVGGAGGNAVNNMIECGLDGCDFVVANTDAQALTMSKADRLVQMGVAVTEGLGAGSQPEIGAAAAEEAIDEIKDHLTGSHMVFVTAGMGGGTGTGSAPVIARAASDAGILTVGVVTKPFQFEGQRRMQIADEGIRRLQEHVDTLIVIPNQNLFRIANEKTTFSDAFSMADRVLYSGVGCITDLMVKEGLINLDFADVRAVMRGMGKAMMGTGEAEGEGRAIHAAESAIANPLLDESSMRGAQGLLISITGGNDLTLFEVDEAASRIREEVDENANIILGATFDESLSGVVRVSVVATGIEASARNGSLDMPSRKPVFMAPPVMVEEKAEAAPAVAQKPVVAMQPTILQQETPTAEVARSLSDHDTAKISGAIADATFAQLAEELNVGAADNISTLSSDKAAPTVSKIETAALALKDELSVQPSVDTLADIAAESDAMADSIELPRLPSLEDFPPIAQQEMRPSDTDMSDLSDRQPLGLLRRLAAGMGRQDETADTEAMTAAPSPERRDVALSNAMQDDAGTLDAHGRQSQQPQPGLDGDQLEIPAFLRRQAR